MNFKKRTIFKRCISILLVIALIPVGNFVGVREAYAETTDNALEKNITLSANLDKEGNIELQWNRSSEASKYVINRNGEELKSIDNDTSATNDVLYSCEVFIGPEKESYVYEVYDFNVISIKRLYDGFKDNGIMLNKGWMITKYYDENEVREKISSIIKNCTSDSDEDTYLNIGSYFRIQES